MKKVMIKIRGTQGENEVTEFSTEGVLKTDGENFVISYFDNAIIKNESVKTVLTAKSDRSVTVERKGRLSSKMFIEKGVRNNCFYSVPEGNLTLGIYGKEIENRLTETGGDLKIVYTLDADMRHISENKVEINVRNI